MIENNIQNNIIIPFVQSLISSVLVFLVIVSGSILFELDNAFILALFIASIVFLFTWLLFRSRTQYVLESVLGIDINHDGVIGDPEIPPEQIETHEIEAPKTLKIALSSNNGQTVDYIDLPYPERLPSLSRGLIEGKPFSQASWTGKNSIYSRAKWIELQNEMLKRGLVRWKNPNAHEQGIEITKPGWAVIRRLNSPTPTE